MSKHILSLLCLAVLGACGSPEPVAVEPGNVCHVDSDGGWKRCNGSCLTKRDMTRLDHQLHPEKAPKASDSAGITTESGSVNDEDYDCHGVISKNCHLKGTCVAQVGLNEPCVNNTMCSEGTCLGSDRDVKGNLIWRCTDPKSKKTDAPKTSP